jgi:multimeric flavodoxin WrbA
MKEADGIIVASPVYFSSATALVKALMERAAWICLHNNNPLRGKVGGSLAVARRAGNNFTLAQLNYFFQILGMTVPGSTYWNVAFGREKGEVENDEEGLRTTQTFARNMAHTIKALHAFKG